MELREFIRSIWVNWYFHDALVFTLVAVLVTVVRRMRKRTYWRRAAKEVIKRRSAVISFYIICVYCAIAIFDSVGWHPSLRDENGAVLRSKITGKVIYDDAGISLLDWMLTPLRVDKEQTYSAPLAKIKFDAEILLKEDGTPYYGNRPLDFPGKHLLGTDKVGRDVLYQALKGIRTGVVIGGLTTILAIPFAIFFGVVAGYFGGFIDDVVQYIYTTLSSIPSVLLIMSFIILFGQGLPQLCIIMGITAWVGLCRVLRGETLKLREMEYVQSAEAMGTARLRILTRHIVPNVLHLVLISTVLAFSGNVMVEAALAFIGIGVGPDVFSWGGMINDARLELARDPVIWWKLAAAFTFMLGLVLPANIFGDVVRDALDPRLRTQ